MYMPLENASKHHKGSPFQFLLFKRNPQNRMRPKGLSIFFRRSETFEIFLSSKCPPSILLKSALVISGVKRYIRTFDAISELFCVFVKRRSENEFFMKMSYAYFKSAPYEVFWALDMAPTLDVPVLLEVANGGYQHFWNFNFFSLNILDSSYFAVSLEFNDIFCFTSI